MTPSPVGMRCPECARQRTKVQRPRSLVAAVPYATYVLIALNVIFFIAQVVTGEGGGSRARSGSFYENLVLFGPFVDQGEWYRMLTAGFLHADPIHLLLNMVVLYFLGQLLEPAIGTIRFVAIYFASLLAGSFGALLLSPDAATVGASGAVFGLMGATFMIMRARGVNPMETFIGPLIIVNVLFTFGFASAGISLGGHLGGLIGGGLAALAITLGERRRSLLLAIIGCVVVGAVAVVGGITAAGTPSLY
jgi:membrane associated rhomboid family serine protease